MSGSNIDQLLEASQLQLSELEMIQSMYPGPKEVTVDCQNAVLERQVFCEEDSSTGRLQNPLSRMDYSINISVDEVSMSLLVSLPPLYPFVKCGFAVRCASLSKQAMTRLSTDLNSELSRQEEGDLCVGILLAWLTDHAPQYIAEDTTSQNRTAAASASSSISDAGNSKKKNTFCRMWVYSHHIYSKVKRKDLQELSEEYDLTGFVLPGKPGLVCVEGTQLNTDTWWSIVRSWNWQKISCKRQETKPLSVDRSLSSHRRFDRFQELGTGDDIRVKGGGYHVDMGDLYRFLKKHASEYMFKEYFGVEGRE